MSGKSLLPTRKPFRLLSDMESSVARRSDGHGNYRQQATARRLERAGEYNGQRSAARNALDPSSGAWGYVKRTAAPGVDAVLDGRNARSAEEMHSDCRDAVSRKGAARRDDRCDYGLWQAEGCLRRYMAECLALIYLPCLNSINPLCPMLQ
jgi:hypothetical protein